jgi:hypothetical protein
MPSWIVRRLWDWFQIPLARTVAWRRDLAAILDRKSQPALPYPSERYVIMSEAYERAHITKKRPTFRLARSRDRDNPVGVLLQLEARHFRGALPFDDWLGPSFREIVERKATFRPRHDTSAGFTFGGGNGGVRSRAAATLRCSARRWSD